jgi:transcriptional regulator with XRE-family HTH domain
VLSKHEQELFNRKLGEIVRNARIKAEVKQEDLSKRLGFKSRISIANIENGKQSVQVTTLIEIAEFLKLPLTDLIPPLETIKKEINPKLIRRIEKEVIDDPESVEKIINFIRFTISKK